MELIKIVAKSRERNGSREARKLRRTGFIPAVVYGRKLDTVAIALPRTDFLQALKGGGRLFTLTTGKTEENAFIADLQHHPVSEEIVHIDFTRVDMNEPVSLEVPFKFKGVPIGVVHGGLTEEVKTSTRVRCLPAAIPSHIEIEISGIEINTAMHLRDLKLPPGVAIDENPELLVVRVVEKAKEEEVAAVAEPALTPIQPEVITKKKEEEEEEE